ncbi:MAG: hypothetical protein CL840_12670 [Crocinitomicaceae bacterium]|nr:hypothetical protein [Crocinitomicaceae bacterium]
MWCTKIAYKLELERKLHKLLLGFFLSLAIVSCKPYKDLQEGEYLVNKVNIEFEKNKAEKKDMRQDNVKIEDLESIIKQKPNKRLFGVFNLSTNLYAYGSRKDNWFRRWMKKMGDEPVILDSTKTAASTDQLRLFLVKKGYFLNQTSDSTVIVDSTKRKAEVTYQLTLNQPYTVKKLGMSMEDLTIKETVDKYWGESKIEIGKNYDEYVLTEERGRIENTMKSDGYYNFDKRFVSFTVDSNNLENGVNIDVNIENPRINRLTEDNRDTLVTYSHRKYTIEEVFIQVRSDDKRYTTIDTAQMNGYVFVNSSKNSIRPTVILRTLYFKPGDQYNIQNIQYTYNRLATLKAFKSININVYPRTNDPNDTTLVAFVELALNSRHSFAIETEGTNRGGNLGVNGSVRLNNRNVFKGAELFQVKFTGGLEAQGTSFEQDESVAEDQFGNSIFNTIEYGIEFGLRLPELLIPKNKSKIPSYTKPSTEFTFGYNHQFRSAYNRDIFKTGLYYNWIMNRKNIFRVGIIDLSLVRIDKAQWFQEKLDASNNSLLINSYNNHLISATKFQYEFNNSMIKENNIRFKTTVETAGNLLRGINELSGKPRDSTNTYYELLGIRYAQYIMVDGFIRYGTRLTRHSSAAYRLYGGIGVPLANLNVLPFEKSYYGGGANSNRAWVSRTMGPGGMADTGSLAGIDRIGDIKLEANFEYRFDIMGSFEGAYFIDAGNIWIREHDPQRPLAEFDVNRFYKELAIGSGLGLRYKTGFFIVRFDVGVKIHDPKLIVGERWLWQTKQQYESLKLKSYYREIVNWNLAIDYPF